MKKLSKETKARIWVGTACLIAGIILGGWWSPRATTLEAVPEVVVEETAPETE